MVSIHTLAIACFVIALGCMLYVVADILVEMGREWLDGVITASTSLRSTAADAIEEHEARQAYEEAQRALAEAIEMAKRASERLVPITRRRGSVQSQRAARAAFGTVSLGASA